MVAADRPDALNELCLVYWTPVYHFLRRSGHSSENAEDLTQSFFAELVKGDVFSRADENSGKLRTYLLGALKRHLSQEQRFHGRQKRGGNVPHYPLATSEFDFEQAEHQYAAQPADEVTPDRLYERRWVTELLLRAIGRLQHDYESAGRGREFSLLKEAVMSTGSVDCAQAARELGVKEASIRVLIHRLRRNFRAAFKDEIAATVSTHAEVETEYRRLLHGFS